jgi:ZIP family zinc transporter
MGEGNVWDSNVWLAFGLSLFAGLSTGIGGVIALLTRKVNTRLLSLALGFSAGVMIYVSFMDILPEGRKILMAARGDVTGSWLAILGFFAGMLAFALIDHLIPEDKNPHEPCLPRDFECEERENASALRRSGLMAALAIAIHNFPEGLATFSAALQNPQSGIAIAAAVAIHNIPEGIAVAVPLTYATGSKVKGFLHALLSGLTEPLGALVGYLVLAPFLTDTLMGLLFAFVAGIMVFISLDELLPTARAYAEEHLAIYGVVLGMAVMAVSLVLFM